MFLKTIKRVSYSEILIDTCIKTMKKLYRPTLSIPYLIFALSWLE